MKKIILLIFFCYPFINAQALNSPYIVRSPRALLMGDAFTAVNDDEFTLFYNPASLARHSRDFSFAPLNPSVSVTNALSDMDRFEDFPDTPQGASEVLMDYPVHASIQYVPGFKLFNFGFSFVSVDRFDALLRNQTHPMLDLDLRSDRGFTTGVGIPIGNNRISKKSGSGHQLSLGLGAKYIRRKGVRDTYALAGTDVLDTLSKDEINEILESLGQVEGRAWGFDAGFEFVAKSGPSKFVLGLSALDITGTNFKVENNPQKRQVANLDNQVNLGMAFGQDYGLFHYIFSADIRSLNQKMDTMQRTRFGVEVGIPTLRFLAGINSGYYSYGLMVDWKFLKIMGGLYDLELGTRYKQTRSRQGIIYLSLFDFSFDA